MFAFDELLYCRSRASNGNGDGCAIVARTTHAQWTNQVVEANPSLKPSEVSKELGREWGKLDAEAKTPYEELARQDKERCVTVLSAPNVFHSTVEPSTSLFLNC